jgi:hypothetical protein
MELNPAEAVLNNVVGTINLVEQSVAGEVSTLVMISTDKAVKPTSVMGATEATVEVAGDGRRYLMERVGPGEMVRARELKGSAFVELPKPGSGRHT